MKEKTYLSLFLFLYCGFLVYLKWLFQVSGFLMHAKWSDLDGQHWLFAVISHLREGVFTNHLSIFPTYYSDIDGDFSLMGYPPIHMLAVRAFATSPDMNGILFSGAVIAGAGLILAAVLFTSVIYKADNEENWILFASAALALTLLFLLDFGGRPETTFIIFLILFLIINVRSNWQAQPWVLGALLGLMGATAPTAALLLSSLVPVLVGVKKTFFDGARTIVTIAATAAVFFVLLLGLRYGIRENFEAMLESLPAQGFAYPSWRLFFKTNMVDWYRPLFGVIFILSVIVIALRFKSFAPKSPTLVMFGIALFSFFSYHAFYLRPHCTYNLLALTPLFLMLVLIGIVNLKRARWAIIPVLSLPLVGFVMQIGIFLDYQSRGLSFMDARNALFEISRRVPVEVKIGLDPSLWLLADGVDDWSRVFLLRRNVPQENKSNAVLIVKEGFGINYAGSLTSSPLSRIVNDELSINHTLVVDCNRKDTMRFLSKHIYQPIYGYGFSVYAPARSDFIAYDQGEDPAEQCPVSFDRTSNSLSQ